MKLLWILVACLAVNGAFWIFRANDLDNDLKLEKAAHEKTRIERDSWKMSFEDERNRSEALADNARRCLEREARAQADAQERAAIMEKAVTRPRTEEEKQKVVDDATRSAVIQRLNRGLRN